MATKALSPGAALLRSSRLFSLPAPIPPAPGDVTGSSKRGSDTATLPFPVLQAVRSPRASRRRGDWGFKRPLPPRAAAASTDPVVRVRQFDAIEQVTDYASATDHAVTLRKWQSLQVPLTQQTEAEQRQNLAGRSVFEEATDVIAIDPALRHTPADKRWKFGGPWLAGITEGAFQAYLQKQVRPRRREFREFLRAQRAADRNAAAAAAALDQHGSSIGADAGDKAEDDASSSAPSQLTAADIDDAELTEYLRALRHDRPLLYRLVGKFLDLAPVEPSDRMLQTLLARASSSLTGGSASSSSAGGFLMPLTGGAGASAGVSSSASASGNPWAQDGPPITHPSAGLSYLRSTAYLDNHPLYGPQKAHPPVEARVVTPRSATTGSVVKMGVAGFVADTALGDAATAGLASSAGRAGRGLSGSLGALTIIDPAVHGGAKLPVRVAAAKVNSQGRIVLSVAEAEPEAVLVQRELAGQERIFGQPARLLSTRAAGLPRSRSLPLNSSSRGATSRYATLGSNLAAASRSTGRGTVVSSPQSYGLDQ